MWSTPASGVPTTGIVVFAFNLPLTYLLAQQLFYAGCDSFSCGGTKSRGAAVSVAAERNTARVSCITPEYQNNPGATE